MGKEEIDADIHHAVVHFAIFVTVGVTWAWVAIGFPPAVLLVVFGIGAARSFWKAWNG